MRWVITLVFLLIGVMTAQRAELSDDARAWLEGRPCGFFEFKHPDELIPIWQAYGDLNIATWDMGDNSKPVAVADPF